ncbi:cytochrome P450 [Rhizoctonia solani]|nr:cytochrome P450 [Rhizoctonia solani]
MGEVRAGAPVVPILIALLLTHYFWHRRSRARSPPSPASFPIVGNLFSIPPDKEHLAFAKLGEQLNSDIVFLKIFGQKILVLNSAEAASDLLDKRSALYSDRDIPAMITDPTLMNWGMGVGTVRYNDLWRRYRRMMNSWLNTRVVAQFYGLQERHTRSLLQKLLTATNHTQPFEQIKDEFFFTTASLIFELAYGYKLQDPQDPFFKEAVLSYHNLTAATMHTNFLVNIFPVMTYIPDWFPGTGWKRTAREWRIQQERAKTEPYEWLKSQVASGKYRPSLLSALLQDHELLSGSSPTERDDQLKEIGSILFGGGTDTSSNLLISFVSAMVLNPEVQARAQQELDNVLGQVALPKLSDKDRLPYVKNLIEELWRLYPVFPLGIPHASFQDDNYRGYDIEKGTTVFGNLWAMGRDSRHYEDPEVFDPDRYLKPDVPRLPVFGWGRRKCPGIHFGEASAFIMISSLLATFTFSKKRDSSGHEITPQIEVDRNSLVLELMPFDFEFNPRSEEHRQLIVGLNLNGE